MTSNIQYTNPADFMSKYGVAGVSQNSDLSGSHTRFWGIPDDYLNRALAQYNSTGSFYGAKDVPVNLEQGLDWITNNYGTTVPSLSGKYYEITPGSNFANFGNPGQYISLISDTNAGDTWAVWNKNDDGSFTNAGLSYYDSNKVHDNTLGMIAAAAATYFGMPYLMEAIGVGAGAGVGAGVGAGAEVGAMSVPGAFGPMSSTAALTGAGSTGAMLGGFGANALGTGLTLAGVDALGPGLASMASSGLTTATDADISALMDSPAGGGGTTADWWKQAISPSSNYSVTDLIRTAIPADWLPTGTGADKLLEKSLGLLGQGQQPTGGILGGGGSSRTPISPYAVNPVAFRQSQYAKIFGE